MNFPNPDQGPGTPYLAANLVSALVFGLFFATELTGTPYDVIDHLKIFIFYFPWIYLVFVIINAVPTWITFQFLDKRGLANKLTATLFGFLLPLFWLSIVMLLNTGTRMAAAISEDTTSLFAQVVSGGFGGFVFMYLYERRNV